MGASIHMDLAVTERVQPRYDLEDRELRALETSLVKLVKLAGCEDGLGAAWIRHDDPHANVVRTYEAKLFPEVAEVSAEDERRTVFLALVDTRTGSNCVIHAGAISGPLDVQPAEDGDKTSFIAIDALIEAGNFTADEFRTYYSDRGINLSACVAIETNFQVGVRAERWRGRRPSDLAYFCFLESVVKRGGLIGHAGGFATINRKQTSAFERIKLRFEPLMGRRDFITPESALGIHSTPVFIPLDRAGLKLVSDLDVGMVQCSI
jgi:hypothetical protein